MTEKQISADCRLIVDLPAIGYKWTRTLIHDSSFGSNDIAKQPVALRHDLSFSTMIRPSGAMNCRFPPFAYRLLDSDFRTGLMPNV